MKLTDAGRVLFVDDDYETVSDVTSSFLKQNIQVQYWNGAGELPKSAPNIRVVIADLDLKNCDMKAQLGDEFYIPLIEAIRKIPGPFVLVFVAREFDWKDPRKFNRVYKKVVGTPFIGFVSRKGLRKADLNPDILKQLIDSILEKNEILDLILTWELLFDKAKNSALSEISASGVEMSIRALVKILCRNCHENKGAARELINEMNRLVSRQSIQNEDFKNIAKIIGKINKTLVKGKNKFFTNADRLLLSKLIFFSPSKEEDILTGDIFETPERFRYGVIFSPKCDLMQSKTQKVLVCYGFPLKKAYFRNKDYPPNKNDSVIVKLHKKKIKMAEIAKSVEKRYLGKKLPDSLHVIWNFTEKEQGICLDFSNVHSVDLDEVKNWNRLCRIDSPYIEEILQKYGSLVSRIGTLEIKSSPLQLQGVIKEIEDDAKRDETRA